MKWRPDLTVPNEVLFDENLTTQDRFIIGVVYTFPEARAGEVHKFLPDYHINEISNRLEVLTDFGYLSKDRSCTFKVKNLLTLNRQDQESLDLQDQERLNQQKSAPKKRIIQRKSAGTSSVLYEVKNTNNTIGSSSPLGEELLFADKTREDEPEKKHIPFVVQPFLDEWFNCDLNIQGEKTKGFAEDIEALKKLVTGKFFKDKTVPFVYLNKRFTLEEWVLAVNRLQKMAFDPEYYPKDKSYLRKMRISTFLFNKFPKYDGPLRYSLFLRLLEEEPRPVQKKKKQSTEEDEYPKITNRLIHLYAEYRKEVLNKYGYKPSEEDLDKFKLASKRIVTFFSEQKGKIQNYAVEFSGKNALADFTWAAVLHNNSRSEIDLSPGFFCSNWTFDKRLPEYLKHKRLIK